MRKIIFFVFLIASFNNLFSQDYIPTKEDLLRFPKTKTFIVLEDNPLSEYNLDLKSVSPAEWKITPYDFISIKEFDKKRLDPACSFIILSKVKFDKDKTNATYTFMSLLLGGNAYSLSSMPDLCSLPLSYSGGGDEEYAYKVGIFLRFFQAHVKMLMDDPSLASVNILTHYNKNMADLKGKTLYLVAGELNKDVNTLSKIRKVYPGEVKLVTKDDIQQAIADKKDVVFLHKVGPEGTNMKDRVYKILIGAADARFYYFDYHKLTDDKPDAFLISDFKSLAKKIK